MVLQAPRSTASETPQIRLGDTFLREWDEGIAAKLGCFTSNSNMYVRVEGVEAPPFSDEWPDPKVRGTKMPGIPVVWASPHEAFEHYVNPTFVVRRQDPELAMDRWADGKKKYVVPAEGAVLSTAELGGGFDADGNLATHTLEGYSAYESQRWPWPYDLVYTIYFRIEGKRAETNSLRMLKYLMKHFKPRDGLDVTDSNGITNSYWLSTDGPTGLSEVIDVANRVRGWALTVKVLGYLDLDDPDVLKTVTKKPTVTVKRI